MKHARNISTGLFLIAGLLEGCDSDPLITIPPHIARISQHEIISDQDYRYIGCPESQAGPEKEQACSGATELDVRECVMAYRMLHVMGSVAWTLRNEYESEVTEVAASNADAPKSASSGQLTPDEIHHVSSFAKAFSDGTIVMPGAVDLSIHPIPGTREIALDGAGRFRANLTDGWNVADGDFTIGIHRYSIDAVVASKYIDVQVSLATTPNPSSQTWTTNWNPPPPKVSPNAQHAKNGTLVYRIFLKPLTATAFEIDYSRGHLIGIPDGGVIGCLWFDNASGAKIMDFSRINAVEKYDDLTVSIPMAESWSLGKTSNLCRTRIDETTVDSCKDFGK